MVGVFDGHGGWQVSEMIQRRVIELLEANLGSKKDEKSVIEALKKTYK